jgi:Trk-type K+ transport system membrane component
MDFWFKVCIGCGVFALIMAPIRRRSYKKRRNLLLSSPREKKEKLLKIYFNLFKIYKLLFWLSPLYFLLLPYLLYYHAPEYFISITLLFSLMYLLTIEDYLFRRKVVKDLEIEMPTTGV